MNKVESNVDVEIVMMSSDLSLDVLNSHIELAEEILVLDNMTDNENYIGGGIEARVYQIMDGFVLKAYEEGCEEGTINVYDSVEEMDCTLLAKNYAVLSSYHLDGASYVLIVQEEITPLKVYGLSDELYENKSIIIKFLKEIYKFSEHISFEDLHSGNLGLSKDGELKILDCGLCIINDDKKYNLEQSLYEMKVQNWFNSFISFDIGSYSGINSTNTDVGEVYEKLIFSLEGLYENKISQ